MFRELKWEWCLDLIEEYQKETEVVRRNQIEILEFKTIVWKMKSPEAQKQTVQAEETCEHGDRSIKTLV